MQNIRHKHQVPKTGRAERAASLAAGTLLIARGVQKKGWGGTALALLGLAFVRRGIVGHTNGNGNPTKDRNIAVPHRTGTRIEEAVTINRPREEVFRFTRDFGNIAELAEHIHSVHTVAESDRSHWVAKGAGEKRLELNTQIINEKENERVAWRSLEGSGVANAGSVLFRDAAGGRGTEVHVEIMYARPFGPLGALVSKFSGEDPSAQVRSDLRRLKARLEAGVLPEIEGQPAAGDGARNPKADLVSKASEASFPASDAPAFSH